MKKIFTCIIALLSLSVTGIAQNSDHLFKYPEPPQDMNSLYQRCNYIVYKFWDQCDFKSAVSSKAKLNAAFGDWLGFMPYASADTVYMAIDKLNEKVKKSGDHSLEVIKMAEAWTYSDSAQYRSDQLYSHFVDAAIKNKKIPADARRHYEAQKIKLDNTSVGCQIPDIELTLADGTKTSFYNDSVEYTLLLIYENDCLDCSFAKVRLSADMVLNQLNDQNVVRVVSLYAGEPDAAFYESVSSFPEKWINVASPEVDKYFNISHMPSLYYLDKDHKIVGKDLNLENILNAFRSMIK